MQLTTRFQKQASKRRARPTQNAVEPARLRTRRYRVERPVDGMGTASDRVHHAIRSSTRDRRVRNTYVALTAAEVSTQPHVHQASEVDIAAAHA